MDPGTVFGGGALLVLSGWLLLRMAKAGQEKPHRPPKAQRPRPKSEGYWGITFPPSFW